MGRPSVSEAENHSKESAVPVDLGPMYRQHREEIQSLAVKVAALKAKGLVFEGVLGYLRGDEKLKLEDRAVVQRENVLRENIFDLIGKSTGKPREEIAAMFVRMAEKTGKQ